MLTNISKVQIKLDAELSLKSKGAYKRYVTVGGTDANSDGSFKNELWYASLGFQKGKSKRDWVDNQTSIIGEDKVAINVSKNMDVTGALIGNNQDGGSRKDIEVGTTKYIDEFVIPETGKTPTNSYIHLGKSIDKDIVKLSEEGGGNLGWLDYKGLKHLAKESKKGGKFDIKSNPKYGGPFDGYLLNDQYTTVRSAGNYLAGLNAGKAKPIIFTDNWWGEFAMKKAGKLHNPKIKNPQPPYYGEIPYAGRNIKQGLHDAFK